MSGFSEKRWKSALTRILEHLNPSQYRKLREFLEEIPKGQKIKKEEMPQVIIEYYGLEESVSAIRDAMEEIPRRDAAVQDLLRPFVEKLNKGHEKENKGQKRKHEAEEDERPTEGQKRKREAEEDEKPTEGRHFNRTTDARSPLKAQEGNCQPAEETNPRPWKKSICDLKSSSELRDTDAIAGRVFQKSGLRTYKTKDKLKRIYFYVSGADETGCIKMMVYGKKLYQQIQEGKSYLFRKLIWDANTGSVKVTTESKVSIIRCVKVPETIEREAQTLIYSKDPVCSIAEAKSSDDKKLVSVQGTVTEIQPIEEVKVQDQRKKTSRQNFNLKDETDSIKIYMWGKRTKQCRGLAVGDVIKVINGRTNKYFGTVSLNSTAFTDIEKVQSVGIQNVRLQMIGIIKATKKETHLEAEFNQQVHTFVASTRLLAKAFDFRLEGDLTETLLDKIKVPVDAEILGNKITKVTTV